MLLRVAVLFSVALVSAQAADARTKRPVTHLAAVPDLPLDTAAAASRLRLLDLPRDSAERWMLQPIASDYDRVDPHGFRLRVRGAKMKMRVPLDLN